MELFNYKKSYIKKRIICLLKYFNYLIIFIFCFNNLFSTSQVIINSQDFRDVYTGNIYANVKNLSSSFFNYNNDNTDILYLIDESKTNIILIEGEINYGNFNYGNKLNLSINTKSSYINNSLFLAELGNFSKFFFLDVESSFNSILIIPMLRKENIFPIFLDLNNSKLILSKLNKFNLTKNIELFYFDEFSFELINKFENFTNNVFLNNDKFENNFFIIDRLNQSGVDVTRVQFVGSEIVERGMFESDFPIIFVPEIITTSFVNKLNLYNINSGFSISNYTFNSIKELIFNHSKKIMFKGKEFRTNPNSIHSSGKFQKFKKLDLIEINTKQINLEIENINLVVNSKINFILKNTGEVPIKYKIVIKFFDNETLLFSKQVLDNGISLDINSLVLKSITFSNIYDKTINLSFEVFFSRGYVGSSINDVYESVLNFNTLIYFPKFVSTPNNGNSGSGTSGSNNGIERDKNDIENSNDNKLSDLELEYIYSLLELNISKDKMLNSYSITNRNYFYEPSLTPEFDYAQLKELLNNIDIDEFNKNNILKLEKNYDNTMLNILTKFKIIEIKGDINKKITLLQIDFEKFIDKKYIGKKIKITVVIPKLVSFNVDEIRGDFKILAKDPVIEFELEINSSNILELNEYFKYIILGDKSDVVDNIKTYYEVIDEDKISFEIENELLLGKFSEDIEEKIYLEYNINKDKVIDFRVINYTYIEKIIPSVDIFNFMNLSQKNKNYENILKWSYIENQFEVLFKVIKEKYIKVNLK
ncbi:MAG: hypothetical protein HRU03_08585, partial [Nanoarchaeales archaeon]|nr:hypothetical protein [Nanoarchaeales archaeon]